MHRWVFISERGRPLNSYGSDRESTWKCERCGLKKTTDDDRSGGPPYAGNPGDCDREVVRHVMES